MRKTLTEQWREGKLPEGFYYMKDYAGGYNYRYLFGVKPDADFVKFFKEVLAPVPSYDEYKKLEQQLAELQTEENNLLNDIVDLNLTIENRDKRLEIATKALKFYSDTKTWDCCIKGHCAYVDSMAADIALKEMEGVK